MKNYQPNPVCQSMRAVFWPATVAISLLFAACTTSAHEGTNLYSTLPDDHAPIGVMGDHNHKQGEWMLAYRYSRMEMDGLGDGTDSVSTTEVLDDYMMAPVAMSGNMHMFGMMYGLTDRLTLTAMLPYIEKSMRMQRRTGDRFTTRSSGPGDIKVNGLYTLFENQDTLRGTTADHGRREQQLLLKLGLSLPSGSIDEKDDTPMGADRKLGYGMQLGSGTYDPQLALTYVSQYPGWSWGTQANAVLRVGENSEGYRLGNQYGLTGWVARNLRPDLSVSLRLDGKVWRDIHGKDEDLNARMSPGLNTDLKAGKRIDALLGINFYQQQGKLAGHRLAAEFGVPVYQDLDGPQMQLQYRMTLGWQYAF